MTISKAGSRRKGAAGELEVIEVLRAHGWPLAHRNFDSGSAGGGDIARGPAGVHLECKRTERAEIWQWIAQALRDTQATTDIPVVAFRRSHAGWWACLPLDELLSLLALREFA